MLLPTFRILARTAKLSVAPRYTEKGMAESEIDDALLFNLHSSFRLGNRTQW